MRYLLLSVLCFFFSSQDLSSQELPMFTQYREFQSFLNPATIPVDYISQGYQPNQTVGISYRNQWNNLSDSPTTMTARYENISEKLNSVFGGNIIYDQTGRFSRAGVHLRYAYRIAFSDYSSLTIGAKFGAFQNRYDSSDAILRDPGDLTGETNVNRISPDFGMGVYFNQQLSDNDVIYMGLSVPQFGNSTGLSIGSANKPDFLYEATHLYFNAGLYKSLGKESSIGSRTMYIEPSIWVKYVTAAPIHTDLNLRVHLPDLIWIGLGYGLSMEDKIRGNFIHFEGGFVMDEVVGLVDRNFKIGFSYDNNFSNSGFSGFGSTFEINLSYSWF